MVVITGISETVKFWLDTWMGMFSILIFMVLIFILLCFWVWTTKRSKSNINKYMNIIAGVLIITSIVFPLVGRVNVNNNISNTPADFNDYWKIRSQSDLQTLEPIQFPLPDIYYIILDGYGSEKILQDVYQFDNSGFERNLESMGFYINRQAHSNYKQTNLSITSSLNFMYLQDVGPEINSPNGGISTLETMFENNRVFEQLRQLSYQVVAFSNGYEQTDLKRTADIYLSGVNSPSSFETGLINTTPLTLLLWRDAYDWHRGKVLYTLSELPATVALKLPKIVFAHILIPHPPFVLSSEGKAKYPNRPFNIYDGSDFMGVGSPREYIEGYRTQVEFINTSITGIIQQILDQAKTPPIIILQGDHGPGLRLDHNDVTKTDVNERFSILSAYYFPDGDYSTVYEGMTPVNTFRVLFNKYFKTNYELLDDQSYFTDFYHPFTFLDVTNQFYP